MLQPKVEDLRQQTIEELQWYITDEIANIVQGMLERAFGSYRDFSL